MRKNSFQFLAAGGVALFLALSLVPVFSGADPDLPDEAFAQTIAADDPFPHQAELAARVNFWRHVFGVWNRRQVALHDMNNPGLIYEVLTLPESGEGRATDRKEFINEHVEDLSRRLHTLEQKVARGEDLNESEQQLLDKFRTLGKISQLPGAHDRVRFQRGIREKFLQGVEVSGRYDPLFRRIFRAHGVPEDLAFLPHVESSFQTNARSGVGAVGIWQFTLPAARTFMKVNAAVDERYDPVLAAEGCARYLANAYEKLGDWGLAITSYNHGVGGMARASSEFGTDFPRILEEYNGPLFGWDSRNFYVEFLAAREVARNAERYFSDVGVHRESPLSWEKVALDHSAPIYKVARDYGVTVSELTEMNTALITGGCGEGFRRRLGEHGVQVIATSLEDPLQAVTQFLTGLPLPPPASAADQVVEAKVLGLTVGTAK
ncbi:membrane-bound lytic murein transglycosylase D [Gammaproteobacteria bacterium]